MVFVDFSESTTDKYEPGERGSLSEGSRSDCRKSLEPGDCILVAPITSSTLLDFIPLTDERLHSILAERWYADNHLVHQHEARAVEEQACDTISNIQSVLRTAPNWSESSKNTSILTSRRPRTKLFSVALYSSYRKVLVILSDMIEDLEDYNFEQMQWTDG